MQRTAGRTYPGVDYAMFAEDRHIALCASLLAEVPSASHSPPLLKAVADCSGRLTVVTGRFMEKKSPRRPPSLVTMRTRGGSRMLAKESPTAMSTPFCQLAGLERSVSGPQTNCHGQTDLAIVRRLDIAATTGPGDESPQPTATTTINKGEGRWTARARAVQPRGRGLEPPAHAARRAMKVEEKKRKKESRRK